MCTLCFSSLVPVQCCHYFFGGGGGGGSGGDRTGRDLLVFKKQSLRLNRLTILDIKKNETLVDKRQRNMATRTKG